MKDTILAFHKSAQHLLTAAEQVRKFGPSGEPSARELERLAHLVAVGAVKAMEHADVGV